MTTICIAGMHRSGTSMIARLLHECGVYLGSASELVPATPDNEDGHWEHLRFLALNIAILARVGAGWDLPPSVPLRWKDHPSLAPIRSEAAELVAGFRGHALWGWKDPRSALTLPLWLELIPDLQVVVCVRHPLDVAGSLIDRGGSSGAFAVNLWQEYYRRILAAAPPEKRVVTHYEVYFQDSQRELERVLNRLGLAVPERVVENACAAVAPRLRHRRGASPSVLQGGEIPLSVVDLYRDLCAEAGTDWEEARRGFSSDEAGPTDDRPATLPLAGNTPVMGLPASPDPTERADHLWAHSMTLSKQLRAMRDQCATLLTQVVQLRQRNALLEAQVANLTGQNKVDTAE